jgi:hypothetical protein
MGGLYDLRSLKQSYMRSAGHLGWAFPPGLGAKAACPDRPVIMLNSPEKSPSFPEPQRALPGCQSLQEDVQPQRPEFSIRVHREKGDLRGSPLR